VRSVVHQPASLTRLQFASALQSGVGEKAKKFYAKVERYRGWKQVPTEKIYETFHDVIRPVQPGFEILRQGFLAWKVTNDVSHGIQLD